MTAATHEAERRSRPGCRTLRAVVPLPFASSATASSYAARASGTLAGGVCHCTRCTPSAIQRARGVSAGAGSGAAGSSAGSSAHARCMPAANAGGHAAQGVERGRVGDGAAHGDAEPAVAVLEAGARAGPPRAAASRSGERSSASRAGSSGGSARHSNSRTVELLHDAGARGQPRDDDGGGERVPALALGARVQLEVELVGDDALEPAGQRAAAAGGGGPARGTSSSRPSRSASGRSGRSRARARWPPAPAPSASVRVQAGRSPSGWNSSPRSRAHCCIGSCQRSIMESQDAGSARVLPRGHASPVASARPSRSPAASSSAMSVASCTSCRSMIRLPKPSSRSVPTIACSGTPAWRVRVPISPTSLPSSVCSSSLPSPVTTARAARIRASKSSASRIHGAPASSAAPCAAHRPPLRPPAAPVIGTPRGSRGKQRGERVQPRLQPGHRRGVGALLRAEDRGRALERRADVGEDHEPRAAQPAVLLDRLERARAAVGRRRAADADDHHLRAGVDRRADQLAGAVRASPPRRRARPRSRGAGPRPRPSRRTAGAAVLDQPVLRA